MRAVETRYAVPGWGRGELWMLDGVVLSHELEFDASAGSAGVAGSVQSNPHFNPPKGAHGPPSGTVAAPSARMGHDFVPDSHQFATTDDRPGSAGVRGDSGRARSRGWVDAEDVVARVVALLNGEDVSFDDVPIDLAWCTPFQHAVAEALRAVPRGEVVSYGELAALAGYPGAARAVGSFCARNRFMIIVPCHRVVAAAGLGDYGSAGTGVKRRLLALEGVRL
jgi:methylated-DNA-[protein]-cysteine S-methyltransferase